MQATDTTASHRESAPLRIGITCYASVGGSGILASALGVELACRGHDVHFISSDRPFRLPEHAPRLHFHPVQISDYSLFKYPDYTLPLSVKMAEVCEAFDLDILHVHYAVPHATAALLACNMLPQDKRPSVITTLHGTDTTLVGCDPGYTPAIRYALEKSDAVTAVSSFLQRETQRLLKVERPIEVIYNFFAPRTPTRTREQVRSELGIGDEVLLLHSSNLRPLKRVDHVLQIASRIRPRDCFKLLILAGDDFGPYRAMVSELQLDDRVIVLEKVKAIEDYFQAADMGIMTSETESFCLTILEAMYFACPSVSTSVGGVPEVITDGQTGCLCQLHDVAGMTAAVEALIRDPERRRALGAAAQQHARAKFSAEAIVPQYESLYRRHLRR